MGCAELGSMYSLGKGVRQDYFKAAELRKKACDGGEASGCSGLGSMYEFGAGVKQDKQMALKYYGMACDMKQELGCENYARLKQRQ